MPCVQTKIQNNQAVLPIAVTESGKAQMLYDQEKKEQSITMQNPAIIPALIDTGATGSCISEEVAEKLNIQADGQEYITGVHGTQMTNIYYVDILLIDIHHLIQNIKLFGIEGLKGNQYKAIIGMDIIQRGTLHFNYRSTLSPGGICTFCL